MTRIMNVNVNTIAVDNAKDDRNNRASVNMRKNIRHSRSVKY